MAKRQILGNPIGVGWIHQFLCAQIAAALGILCGQQVALAGAHAHYFACGCYFKPLGHCFPCLDTFGSSHKINSISKEREI
jgi:hypothetical protein